MCLWNKDQSLIANPLLVYLLDMEMQNLAISYGIQKKKKKKMIRSRDVVFHENENLAKFEKTEKPKAKDEGVLDLTPTSSSLDNATNREEVQDEIMVMNQLILMLMSQQVLMVMM